MFLSVAVAWLLAAVHQTPGLERPLVLTCALEHVMALSLATETDMLPIGSLTEAKKDIVRALSAISGFTDMGDIDKLFSRAVTAQTEHDAWLAERV